MQDSTKRKIIEFFIISVIILATIIILFVAPMPTQRVYDCRLSEISPDFPIEVRNECRKLRAGKV